jgi:2-polyprenyl-3-methyl-5-hydroxy-6-metoxy-1,4-benzoquinol methylase
VNTAERPCRICGSRELTLVKAANYREQPRSDSFAVTDSNYGVTAAIYRCGSCTFLQCPELGDVTGYYEELADEAYEAGRPQRSLQSRRILERIRSHRPDGRLLDVGAGTGMLVEQAVAMGYEAEGVEPSRWMQGRAGERGLPVRLGTFPHPQCKGPYDVVTLIDVIEHVADPLGLLRSVREALRPGGLLAVVTPDVRSLAARLLGRRWWHFRLVHIGYFDRNTLTLATRQAGLELVAMHRPGWFFPGDYLFERAVKFVLPGARLRSPRALRRLTVPVNLGDSLLGIYRRA